MEVNVPGKFDEVRVPMPWGHIAGRWYGDQLRRPILALHGWLDNCGTFAKLAPLLAEHVSLLCIDLPGHGHSSHLPVGMLYSNMEYVRCIRRLMLVYGWNKVSLMGHSMGGTVAFYFASIFPDMVDMVISLDIFKSIYITPLVYPNITHEFIERAMLENERLQWSDKEPPSYTWEECERRMYEGSRRSIQIENCKYILERNVSRSQLYPEKYYFSRDARIKYMNEMNPSPAMAGHMVGRIANCLIPYLVLFGGSSSYEMARTVETLNEMAQQNSNFQMEEVNGGTHHLHLNNAEHVTSHILPFLRRHRLMPKTGNRVPRDYATSVTEESRTKANL